GDAGAIAEGLHRRDALDAERLRDCRCFVHVQLGEDERAVVLGRQTLQDRPDDAAGPAPGSPEVDDDGDLLRALEDLALEVTFGHLYHGCALGHRGQTAECSWRTQCPSLSRPRTLVTPVGI